MDAFKKQVDKEAYRFERYAGEDRFASYHAQIREIIAAKPARVLEVGVGDQVVARYLTHNTSIHYTSVDIAEDVGADIIASVTALPCADRSFDVVCAFEVLEHLPFEHVATALRELVRVARDRVIVSVPHFGPPVKVLFKVPFLPEVRVAFKIPVPLTHTFNGQHYWELGKRGYPVSRFRALISEYATLEREFVPFGNQYHHFFILRPLTYD